MSKVLKCYVGYIPWIIVAFGLLYVQATCDLALPDYMSTMVSEGILVSDMSVILNNGGVMLLYALAGTVCSVLVGYISAFVGAGVGKKVRGALFVQVSNYSNSEFDKFTVSSLITRSTNDITQIQMFTTMLIRMVCYAPIIGIGGIIKAVQKSAAMPTLVWVIVVAVGVLLLAIFLLIVIVQPKFMKLQKLVDKLNLVAREGLNGMMVVRAFNTSKHEEERFDKVNKELTNSNLFVNRIMSLLMPIINLVMNGVSLAVIWIASFTASNIADVGNIMAFMQYAVQIVMAFMMVSMVFILMPRAIVSAKRVGEALKCDISIKDKPNAIKAENIKGVVEFKNVDFKYNKGEEEALSNISFVARPGQTTAIIGSTGSGKSTLIGLIPRLYDATEGTVTIDGTDVRDFTLESLRDTVAFVPQKNVLFSGTIETNIKYADEKGSDESMIEAATTAQAIEFISSKDEGYKSEIAQGGGNVSGGQKQRLAIARALYKKCPVYVFDDSFSALDFKTDSNLRKALKEKVSDATVMIVAQRVGTIMNADQIIVLDEGKIVGIGKHSNLMESCQVYADIAHSQLSKEELSK